MGGRLTVTVCYRPPFWASASRAIRDGLCRHRRIPALTTIAAALSSADLTRRTRDIGSSCLPA
ncbi:hypothetical protein [Streptomyces sp. PSAA01]|uniref:hypothetical protein n=1 Tax=Streptomyces sp. PSAA01 TaxID=2912762 RepID=UPI001F314729|nr:hypothetical protein [Streptomyces sp. PSAA01]MCG0287373.1 hypothetical protein [Streptomyces sp. PSAA01]